MSLRFPASSSVLSQRRVNAQPEDDIESLRDNVDDPDSQHRHGSERTRLSEKEWRYVHVIPWLLGLAGLIALIVLGALAVDGINRLLNKMDKKFDKLTDTVTTGGSGLADPCSSTGEFAWVSAACPPINQSNLPFESTANGDCYRFDADLEWTGDASAGYAIQWFGNRGTLHFCGHSLTLTSQSGRGVVVHGSFGNDAGNAGGELTIYDGNIESPTNQYNALGRGFSAQFGGTLNLYDARAHNIYRGVSIADATLYAENLNVTNILSLDDPNRALAWDQDLWGDDAYGTFCLGAVSCVLKNYLYTATHDDASGDYRAVPAGLQSTGFQCMHNQNPSDPFSVPGECRVDGATITASFGITSLRSRATLIDRAEIHVLGGVESQYPDTFWGPIDQPENMPFTYNFGARLGCGNASNVEFRNSVIDARGVSQWSVWNPALWISGTEGVLVDSVSVLGNAPQPMWVNYPSVPLGDDGYVYAISAMVAVEPVEDSERAGPIRLTRVNVRNDDGVDGIGMTVASNFPSVYAAPGCFGQRTMVTAEHCSFSGDGGVGVLVGAQSQQHVSIADSDFDGQYYGVFAFDDSDVIDLARNVYTRHCEAIHVSTDANNVLIADPRFLRNAVNVMDVSIGGTVSLSNIQTTGETGFCELVPPVVRDVTQNECPLPGFAPFAETPRQLRAQQVAELQAAA